VEQKKAITDVIDRYRFAQLKQICFILTIFPIAPEKKNESNLSKWNKIYSIYFIGCNLILWRQISAPWQISAYWKLFVQEDFC